MFVLLGRPHSKGQQACGACARGFPKPCECGALVHAGRRTMPNGLPILLQQCERCGRARVEAMSDGEPSAAE